MAEHSSAKSGKRGRQWRTIVSRTRRKEETYRVRGRIMSWRMTPVWTIVLSCGHTRTIRGDSVPKLKAACSQCEAMAASSEAPSAEGAA